MDTLTGAVERITFYNAENGYTVLRLRPDRRVPGLSREGLVTVVGHLPDLTPGESVSLQGRWKQHPRFGLQFVAEDCQRVLPASAEGIRRYLGSGLVRGIGPRLAERIVAHFGTDTLRVLDEQPQRLREVPAIGPKRAAALVQAWQEQKAIQRIMLFLHDHGIPTGLAVKIYKTYGDEALQVVREDPYRLARDIRGVGFKTADKVAQAMGLPADHPSRLAAGLRYALQEAVHQGHVYLPRDELLHTAQELLGIEEKDALDPVLTAQTQGGELILEDVAPPPGSDNGNPGDRAEPQGAERLPGVYLPPLYTAERGLAERIVALQAAPSRLPANLRFPGAGLTPAQQQAVRQALRSPVSILTGGPGTGKTTTVRALIAALEQAGVSYLLAAPTGRAAKRLAEATEREAVTVHRLLGYQPGTGFRHGPENPLPAQVVVVDEASMLDLLLAYFLVGAVPPGAHLLLVGDVDQLPAVGPGDVLRHLIASGRVPVTRLETVFRQAAGSYIITNAHRINRGEMPLFPKDAEDFFLFPAATPEEAARWVVEVTTRRIPRKFGLDPLTEIQVIAPMYRGPAGVHALNAALQKALNPPAAEKPEVLLFGQMFRLGDRVMQTENNYDAEVFNGDLGVITEIDRVRQTLTVDFDTHRVRYAWSEADQIVLAYAISVHKSQGAEFPAVVIPLVTQHYLLLRRNLLYTAVTRAQRLCVLVGQRRAIAIAVRDARTRPRYSALAWRIALGG